MVPTHGGCHLFLLASTWDTHVLFGFWLLIYLDLFSNQNALHSLWWSHLLLNPSSWVGQISLFSWAFLCGTMGKLLKLSWTPLSRTSVESYLLWCPLCKAETRKYSVRLSGSLTSLTETFPSQIYYNYLEAPALSTPLLVTHPELLKHHYFRWHDSFLSLPVANFI